MSAKKTSATIAREMVDAAERLGFTLAVRGSILTISKKFTPGSEKEFAEADMMYYEVLGLLPRTSAGSDWGTDGGSVGAISAVKTGVFTMNRSGGSKRVLNALAKLI